MSDKHMILLQVEVSEPEEISPGVFRTYFTHPDLDGSLTLVHGLARKRAMEGLDQSLASVVGNISTQFKELANDFKCLVDPKHQERGKVGEQSPGR